MKAGMVCTSRIGVGHVVNQLSSLHLAYTHGPIQLLDLTPVPHNPSKLPQTPVTPREHQRPLHALIQPASNPRGQPNDGEIGACSLPGHKARSACEISSLVSELNLPVSRCIDSAQAAAGALEGPSHKLVHQCTGSSAICLSGCADLLLG
jgi:hypothetical protein